MIQTLTRAANLTSAQQAQNPTARPTRVQMHRLVEESQLTPLRSRRGGKSGMPTSSR